MTTTPVSNDVTSEHYVQQLQLRSAIAARVYRCILNGFQCFVASQAADKSVSQETLRRWLEDRIRVWPIHMVVHRGCVVDRFMDWMVSESALANNPFADLRREYGQRRIKPVIHALLEPDFEAALEALRPTPRFASFLGPMMRAHVSLKQAMGYGYNSAEERLLRLDRFLQGRPDLSGHPVKVLIREWAKTLSTPQQALECHETGRVLSKALARIDPTVEMIPWDKRIIQEALRRHRRPYLFSESEVHHLLETALLVPSPLSPLRPKTLRIMLVLAYCAGLRISEILRLNVGDFDVDEGTIEIRRTKFFKSRRLPLSVSVVAALQSYLDVRRQAGGPTLPDAALCWHQGRAGRYARASAEQLLAGILRQAGLKPEPGRIGPRVHDLRHSFVLNRMLAWYQDGINPQARLPYLATYLGHRDINSTLVYLTITQELLQQASERFRVRGIQVLGSPAERGDV